MGLIMWGIRAVRVGFEMLWEVPLWPEGLLCLAWTGYDGSSCPPVLPGIAPSSLHLCTPRALSVPTVGTCQPFPPGAGPALTHPAAKEELENILPTVPVHEGVVLEHRGGGGLLTVGLRGLLGKVVGPVVLV